ncbi:TPA: nucleotidyltransferase family protein [Candidatus Micrarchaeota archaeon]|nr:MAG: hypothetical protein AUJ65_02365 [Candidatus Micrarchaeota archaeon CG1_02_51_15]HII39113.1 nucleotidyltransferase family protein [Candidatus Micrarchaeota archaeon]
MTTVAELKKKIVPVLKKSGIKRAGLFGSWARGDQRANSDVDVLFLPPKGFTLFDLSSVAIELKTLLKREVDLVSYRGIHPLLKDQILAQEMRIL